MTRAGGLRRILTTIVLCFGVSCWNYFFSALLYINDSAKWPLQLVLRTYVDRATALREGVLLGGVKG
jgi:multiple sugar transport system permease protein/putative aldouronate transport system permease protein